MPETEHFDVVIRGGSGQGGKLLAWHLGPFWEKGCRRGAPLGRRVVPGGRLPAVKERTPARAYPAGWRRNPDDVRASSSTAPPIRRTAHALHASLRFGTPIARDSCVQPPITFS
jgi:hypothetical protein